MKERGMHVQENDDEEKKSDYVEGEECYHPLLPKRILQWKIMKYIPTMPYLQPETEPCTHVV